MKGRVRLCAVALLALVSVVGCGGEYVEPAGNRVPLAPQPQTAPTEVKGTEGNAGSTVTWTAPTSNGGLRITGYSIRALRDGAEPVTKTQPGTETTATMTGLTNGATYTFTVAALSELGEGPRSEPSAPVMPRATPDAPGNVTVTPGNREVVVTWEAPRDNGMPLNGYTVVLFRGETEVARQAVTETRATFGELTNGTAYRVTVAANNAVVSGPTSAAVEVTPRTVPAAPRVEAQLVANGNRRDIRVSCEYNDDGGSSINNHSGTVYRDGTQIREWFGGTCDYTLESVAPGRRYVFHVRVHNAVGPSPDTVVEVVP